MKCVILAGGLGTRLSEETDRVPKPMVQIGGRPMLWHIIKSYSHWGVNDFVICLGYKGYVIKEYFANYYLHNCDVTFDMRDGGRSVIQSQAEPWRVTLVDTGQDTMTGGRIRRILPYVAHDEAFCLTYGDGLSSVDIGKLIDFHKASGKLATVTAVPPPQRFGLVQIDGDDSVTSFAEKPDVPSSWINGGFFVLSPKIGQYLDDDTTVWERQPLERIANEGQLSAFRHEGFWQPMDTLREKNMLEDLWATRSAPWKVWS
jgi:glucose-1-phosphate cytidylyltransferase